MQIYTITHELSHLPLQSYVYPPPNFSHFPHRADSFYLRNRPHPPLLLTHSCKEDAPHLPTFAQYTTHAPHHISPPLPDSSSTNDPTSTHLYLTTHARTAPHLRTLAIAPAYISPNFYGKSPRRSEPSPDNLRKSSHTLTHLPHHSSVPTRPSHRTFIKRPMYVHALFYRGDGRMVPWGRSGSSHTIKSLVPSCTSVCTEVLEKSL